MSNFLKPFAVATLILGVAGATNATAKEPIVGTWKAESGALVKISPCGSAFCAKVVSGKFNGRSIGKMTGKNGQYSGTLTDLAAGKTYKGKGWMSGNKLKMRGYSGIFFSTQTWSRR